MPVQEGIDELSRERKFWRTPELVEKLLAFLDLASIKELAKSHRLTRQILGKSFVWNQLIKKIFPKDHNIDPVDSNFPQEDDAVLASERGKARLLTEILSLSEDSDRSQLGKDLLHTICERHPILDLNSSSRLVDVGCSRGQTHTVSLLGFLLLKDVQGRVQGILSVERVKAQMLEALPLTALGSIVTDQLGMVKKLDVKGFMC